MSREGGGGNKEESQPKIDRFYDHTLNRLASLRGVVQLVMTPACDAGGRGFEFRVSQQCFSAKCVRSDLRGGRYYKSPTQLSQRRSAAPLSHYHDQHGG